jgi:hypothetical protein
VCPIPELDPASTSFQNLRAIGQEESLAVGEPLRPILEVRYRVRLNGA